MKPTIPCWMFFLVSLGACGDSSKGAADKDAAPSGRDAASSGRDAGIPEARCEAPALYDVSTPTTVVGEGTPASCSEAALRAATSSGGVITFDCGDTATTIELNDALVVTKATVIDGGGLISLSAGGRSRILYLDSGYDTPEPRLVVQRLNFRGGKSPAEGPDTAQGGGAIYRDGGSLTVLDCHFKDNHAPQTGQDVAGGAIYGFGGGDIIIAGSSFRDNTASDGGAVGSLNGDLTIINSDFIGNTATGEGGNPGNGGAGGAIYQDGGDEKTSLCGVTIADNSAGAIGGGYFRVSNDKSGSFAMDRSTVDNNVVSATGSGNAGGLYLQGLALTISASTISRNRAFYCGGLWINNSQVEMVNSTIANNEATGSNGGGIWLGNNPTGTIKNCTIAGNASTAAGQISGAIFGDGLSLVNSIVANNTAMYTPGCNSEHGGSGNLQWPDGALCSASPLIADPKLGVLSDHGGDNQVMMPGPASPAIGLASDCPATDQLGNARSELCTAGAVEPL